MIVCVVYVAGEAPCVITRSKKMSFIMGLFTRISGGGGVVDDVTVWILKIVLSHHAVHEPLERMALVDGVCGIAQLVDLLESNGTQRIL